MKYLKILAAVLLIVIIANIGIYAGGADLYFNYLKSLYDQQNKKLYDYLIIELRSFPDQFPESEYNAEASYLVGKVHLQKGDEHDAIAALMKTVFLYPDELVSSNAISDVNRIINENSSYQKIGGKITTAMKEIAADDDRSDRYYAYLDLLYNMGQPKLYGIALGEFYNFIRHYPDDKRVERIHRLIAGTLAADKKHLVADAAYAKYEVVYPDSDFIPFVKNRRAQLLYRNLKQYNRAVTVLTEVIDNYSGSEYEAEAYLFRGEIKSDKLKQYESAIADYRNIVNKFPENNLCPKALLAMAEIREKKLKQFSEAITIYNELIEKYPQDRRTITALEEAARIHIKMRQMEEAAAKLARIANDFPDYDDSPKHLMKAGKICDNDLKDFTQSIEYYQQVVFKYPDTKEAKRAEKILVDLREKAEW